MIEFASNAAVSAFIELSSFTVNYDYQSRMNFDFIDCTETARERVAKQKVMNIVENMKKT